MSGSPNPDGPPPPDAGFFGVETPLDDARFQIIPVPFEATVSYREGTADGPEAMRRASHQLDLLDPVFGDLREHGWATTAPALDVRKLSDEALGLARGPDRSQEDTNRVGALFDEVAAAVDALVTEALAAGRVPVVVGGDHSVALPGLLAARRHNPEVGVLQVDAHADLRVAYEGFKHSHASVMRNFLENADGAPLMQLGIRDCCQEELDAILAFDVDTVFDRTLVDARFQGEVRQLLERVVDALPPRVWVSFDIDGMDPGLCPNTGTPVPGGLRWEEAGLLLELVGRQRTVVGIDLVEVSPGRPAPEGDSWDAMVGARLLYRLMGAAVGAKRPDLPGL